MGWMMVIPFRGAKTTTFEVEGVPGRLNSRRRIMTSGTSGACFAGLDGGVSNAWGIRRWGQITARAAVHCEGVGGGSALRRAQHLNLSVGERS